MEVQHKQGFLSVIVFVDSKISSNDNSSLPKVNTHGTLESQNTYLP